MVRKKVILLQTATKIFAMFTLCVKSTRASRIGDLEVFGAYAFS
jgi:hypothetical protein